jgi:shikimate dehydrogenase
MFNAAFAETGRAARYTRISTLNDSDIIDLARRLKVSGMNITAPFKETIVRFLDHMDVNATACGAVNTVSLCENRLNGFNTDVVALVQLLTQHLGTLTSRRTIVLGAGGSARAACQALVRCKAASITIANRGLARAQALAAQYGASAVTLGKVNGCLEKTDLLIACVPKGVFVPDLSLLPGHALVVDAAYPNSPLTEAAQKYGLQCINGEQWLLAQGSESYRRFFNEQAPREMVLPTHHDTPYRKNNLFLIGYMGAGKSAVGRALAKQRGLDFVDIDLLVEAEAGMSIARIFNECGESRFREIERRALQNVRRCKRQVAVACGGGTILDPENREFIVAEGFPVWLYAPVETLAKRASDCGRPLGASHGSAEFFDTYARREPIYKSIAELVVPSTTGTVEDVAQVINAALG